LGDYLTIPVFNAARSGRSTRSFINEGLWSRLLSGTAPGDFVLIEMGHNDEGDPSNSTSHRATLPGIGDDTVETTTASGKAETVHSFGWYLRKMVADIQEREAIPLISGMVNRNQWRGEQLRPGWPFARDAAKVAKKLGVEYIDHTHYSVAVFQQMGSAKASAYFPNDHTHTNPGGARINAETLVQAIKCACRTSQLVGYLNDKASEVSAPACLEEC